MINKKRLIVTGIISILLVSILFLGSTYSIFTSSEIDDEMNVFGTGDLNINYSSNDVKINDVTPMTEEEADAVIPHRITVTNNGTVSYMFDLILTDTTPNASNIIGYQYIMTKVGYLEPKKLSSCTDNVIKEDIIILPGESVDIDVRVWISDDINNSEIGKSFNAKLSIDGLAVYNDNTEIDNSMLSLKYMKDLWTYDFRTTNSSSSSILFYNDYFKNIKYNDYVKSFAFVDYIDLSSAVEYWDVSLNSDESIICWIENNEISGYYDVYIGSDYEIYVEDLSFWFFNFSQDNSSMGMNSLSSISFDNLNTSLTIDMCYMFAYLPGVINLDLSSFDTSNVNNMMFVFAFMRALTNLDLSSFDTSEVNNMNFMFYGCSSLISLDISGFDISNVTDIGGMFFMCSSLTSLDLSNFNTSNVIGMYQLFSRCSSLTSLDLSNFDTSKVTNMKDMFSGCSSLTSLDVSGFDTSKVTNMSYMFSGCSSLTSLDVSGFDTSNVINMTYMFNNCYKLSTIITIRSTSITNYASMFTDAATDANAQITVNYTSATSTLVDNMINTKSSNSNVVKGVLVA